VCYHSQLSRKVVQNIHLSGGSLLGVSRGGPGVSDIVDSLEVSDSDRSNPLKTTWWFHEIHGIIHFWLILSYYLLIIDFQERGINMLFVLGGNGTHAGANAIHNEVINLIDLWSISSFLCKKICWNHTIHWNWWDFLFLSVLQKTAQGICHWSTENYW
jgi:6-phosphofructokinase